MSKACQKCDGCGEVASSDDGEPWTFWTSLPPQSQLAVRMGLVYPIPCPECGTQPHEPTSKEKQP